jgi:hypothetical protein
VNVNQHDNNDDSNQLYEIIIRDLPQTKDKLWYFIEGIDNEKTNPSKIYENYGKPNFPNHEVLNEMRTHQNPFVCEQPTKIVDGKIIFNYKLRAPFVLAIRICSENTSVPKKIRKLRHRKINEEEILLSWKYSSVRQKCIMSFELFFKPFNAHNYQKLQTHHIPFLCHQFKHTIPGCFKVRAVDIFNQKSKLSSPLCI